MKVHYVAEDGTIFVEKEECAKYEDDHKRDFARAKLMECITNKCKGSYCSDAGFHIISEDDVLVAGTRLIIER